MTNETLTGTSTVGVRSPAVRWQVGAPGAKWEHDAPQVQPDDLPQGLYQRCPHA